MSRICPIAMVLLISLIGCTTRTTQHNATLGRSAPSRPAAEAHHPADTFSLPVVTKEYYLHAKELLQKHGFDSLDRIDFTRMRFSFAKYYTSKSAKEEFNHGSLHGFPITADQMKLVKKLNEEMGKGDFARARVTVDKLLEINYTDLQLHVIRSEIDYELKSSDTLHSVIGDKLLASIQSVNDGLSAYSPLHLIADGEMEEMLSALEFTTLKSEELDGNLFAVTFIDDKNDTVKVFCEVNGYVASKDRPTDWQMVPRPGSEIGRPYFIRSPDKIREMVERSDLNFIRCDSINDILYKAYFTGPLNDTLKSYFQIVRFPKTLPKIAECEKADSAYYVHSLHDVDKILEVSGFTFLQGNMVNNCFEKVLYLDKNDTMNACFKLIRNQNDSDDDCGIETESSDKDSPN